jgi:hypothetical protein
LLNACLHQFGIAEQVVSIRGDEKVDVEFPRCTKPTIQFVFKATSKMLDTATAGYLHDFIVYRSLGGADDDGIGILDELGAQYNHLNRGFAKYREKSLLRQPARIGPDSYKNGAFH